MITFAEALEQTKGIKRYLLLGNGFSISLFANCFTYGSLFEEAKKSGALEKNDPLEAAFETLDTTDFEEVMEALKAAVKLSKLYGFDGEKMSEHAEVLKDILVQAIAGKHPSRPNDITEDQYKNSRAFLAEFIGIERKNLVGKIFTLNYDLLLYWSLLHDIFQYDWDATDIKEVPDQVLKNDDGFRTPENDYDAKYVAWDQFGASHYQTITYLHGALHLYERGAELAKLCWERSGNKPLIDQIRAALDEDRYPLFVSEGSSESKLERINNSAYLSKALRSFDGCCRSANAALFVIGHSLAGSDEHILKRIEKGKIRKLYVSIFGDPNSESNILILKRAEKIKATRIESCPLELYFVQSESLHIWDH